MSIQLTIERKKKNLTITQLAKVLKVSKQVVCNWEKQRQRPRYERQRALEKFFNKPIDDLLRPVNEPHNSPTE